MRRSREAPPACLLATLALLGARPVRAEPGTPAPPPERPAAGPATYTPLTVKPHPGFALTGYAEANSLAGRGLTLGLIHGQDCDPAGGSCVGNLWTLTVSEHWLGVGLLGKGGAGPNPRLPGGAGFTVELVRARPGRPGTTAALAPGDWLAGPKVHVDLVGLNLSAAVYGRLAHAPNAPAEVPFAAAFGIGIGAPFPVFLTN